MVTCRVEKVVDVKDEIAPLLARQWHELATYDDIPLDPDWALYQKMDEIGALVACTARDGLRLIGYAVYFIRPSHHHYRDMGWAQSDIIWLDPEFRRSGIGSTLLAFVEEELARRGVGVMETGAKLAHPALGMLLSSRGHAKFQESFTKRLPCQRHSQP